MGWMSRAVERGEHNTFMDFRSSGNVRVQDTKVRERKSVERDIWDPETIRQ